MHALRRRAAPHRRSAQWSLGILAGALVVGQLIVGQPFHDVLHLAFVAVAVAFIAYEAVLTVSPYVGLLAIALEVVMAWPRSGGYPGVGGVLTFVVAVYILATRPVAGAAAVVVAPASQAAAGAPPAAEPLPKPGDPGFRYLSPPDGRG